MERISLPQVVILLLAFFHLFIISIAVPSARVQRVLLHAKEVQPLDETPERITGESTMEDVISRRTDLERDDYPGSGANNRHTPKPTGRRRLI